MRQYKGLKECNAYMNKVVWVCYHETGMRIGVTRPFIDRWLIVLV